LSGGQAQRLSLARAFLRDAPLLVMDEPTSHLDPLEERLLAETIRDLCHSRSSLVIAHRLATVYRADQILVIDQGQVVECGSHNNLMRRDGVYTRLVRSFGGEP
jgi:ABC-type multidrug transport system fused ATPase/permease subunit